MPSVAATTTGQSGRRKGTDALPSKSADTKDVNLMSLRIANSVPDFPRFQSGRRKGKPGKKKITKRRDGRLRICIGIRRAAGKLEVAKVKVPTRTEQATAHRTRPSQIEYGANS